MSGVNPWSAIQKIAEERILEAEKAGILDDLPGAGKPLPDDLMENVPEDLRMAYRILRNAGCLPPELAERKEISRLVDLLENCNDEKQKLQGMQKLRFMVDRARIREGRSIRIEQDDPYYAKIISRLEKLCPDQGN